MQPLLKIATRKSPLALKQVELVVAALTAYFPVFAEAGAIEVVPIVTSGDAFLDSTLRDIGGKGLFTKEIDEALLDGRADIAVHSAKDMQTEIPEGLLLAACLPRADARDILISTAGYKLATLPQGAKVGTASLRRGLFIKHVRPDIETVVLRGNIQTRMKKVAEGVCDATILALAGVQRMGIEPHSVGQILSLEEMIPAPAQGIIAVQCRANDLRAQAWLHAIDCEETMQAAMIERAILRALDGSCKTPIAAYVEASESAQEFRVRAMLGDEVSGRMVMLDERVDIRTSPEEIAVMCAGRLGVRV